MASEDETGAFLVSEEDALERIVRDVLRELAAELADAIGDADEITAAAFSIRSIAQRWQSRIPRILGRLFRTADGAVQAAAETTRQPVPAGFDDLESRYERNALPSAMETYRDQVERGLETVGTRIQAAARDALREGLAQGEDTAQLRARLTALLAADAPELGAARAARIAATETTRAWNAALIAAAAASGSEVAIYKTWNTQLDNKVREAHAEVEDAQRPLARAFTVGGVPMQYPGDPSAPPDLYINCRCYLTLGPGEVQAAADPDSGHTGGMIALIPSQADADRLALEGGELAEDLHVTLLILTDDASGWTNLERADLTSAVRAAAQGFAPVQARTFGVNAWNPCDSQAWVYATGDADPAGMGTGMAAVRDVIASAIEDVPHPDIPVQYSPWVAHLTAAYTPDSWPFDAMAERLGPVTFDRVRVAFGPDHIDIPFAPTDGDIMTDDVTAANGADVFPVRTWTTPDDTALAFEDQETGDGRIFAPGVLYWEHGPWPLQYCERLMAGHDGAELAGAIQTLGRDSGRLTGEGVLYLSQRAGWEAAQLLDQGAPLGVSVDLDDVKVEFVSTAKADGDANAPVVIEASYAMASVLHTADGWTITASARPAITASDSGVARTTQTVTWTVADGRTGADIVRTLTAAAGDPDGDGTVLDTDSADAYVTRIVRGRVRGATLVPIPAFARATIVLDPLPDTEGVPDTEDVAASALTPLALADQPASLAEVAAASGRTVAEARIDLANAVAEGRATKLGRFYIAGPRHVAASVTGDTDLPVHSDPDVEWDGDAAKARVFEWADGDTGKLGMAFLWKDDDADASTQAAWKLGFADVFDGALHIVPKGVFAIASVLQGGRGGVDVPEDDMDGLRSKVDALYERISEATGEDHTPPWDADGDADLTASVAGDPWTEDAELTASAWTAVQSLPPMPAAWFKEPTSEELPPGSGGVHYKDGRVYGWVAQKGVPHASYGRSVTIEKLHGTKGFDYSHFLRKPFLLDDGTEVRAGAFTMNVGHHRDGYECETDVCQFDDTRTVAAVVTVGYNEGGMWFSGAGAPWISEWDRTVFASCQPSYHMTQGTDGRWQLKAVLSVPVPGHSSPLAASVIERSNMALAASAAMAVPVTPVVEDVTPADTFAELLDNPAFLDRLTDALSAREVTRADEYAAIEQARREIEEFAATLDIDATDPTKGA